MDDDLGAVAGQLQGDCTADAGRRARHEGFLALEVAGLGRGHWCSPDVVGHKPLGAHNSVVSVMVPDHGTSQKATPVKAAQGLLLGTRARALQVCTMQGTVSGLVASYGYVVLFFLVGLESLGLPLPGETALVTAAALAALGHLSIYGVVATAVAAAVIGDNGGYWIGRNGGIALVRRYGRLLPPHEAHLQPARHFLAGPGPPTVLLRRSLAPLPPPPPALARAARLPHPRSLL